VQFTVTIKYDGSYKAITTQTIVANTQWGKIKIWI
jgi:hypothetical protein